MTMKCENTSTLLTPLKFMQTELQPFILENKKLFVQNKTKHILYFDDHNVDDEERLRKLNSLFAAPDEFPCVIMLKQKPEKLPDHDVIPKHVRAILPYSNISMSCVNISKIIQFILDSFPMYHHLYGRASMIHGFLDKLREDAVDSNNLLQIIYDKTKTCWVHMYKLFEGLATFFDLNIVSLYMGEIQVYTPSSKLFLNKPTLVLYCGYDAQWYHISETQSPLSYFRPYDNGNDTLIALLKHQCLRELTASIKKRLNVRYTGMTIRQLKQMCQSKGIKRCSRLNKQQLVDRLLNTC